MKPTPPLLGQPLGQPRDKPCDNPWGKILHTNTQTSLQSPCRLGASFLPSARLPTATNNGMNPL
ncbi:MAG: hypothetical protein AN485_22705 [Anabaena sp. MDT14b]|nr:MAG: hypothetical protein AN485_22705 [Anabaena sp. MDT14b]